jgi:hypothetical protein
VCAILFDLETTDVQGPLERFQATKFSKADILQLMNTINSNACEQALAPSVLESVFNKWWPDRPDLETEVRNILSAAASSAPAAAVRSDRSLLEETLALVRSIAQEQSEIRAETFRGKFSEVLSSAEDAELLVKSSVGGKLGEKTAPHAVDNPPFPLNSPAFKAAADPKTEHKRAIAEAMLDIRSKIR